MAIFSYSHNTTYWPQEMTVSTICYAYPPGRSTSKTILKPLMMLYGKAYEFSLNAQFHMKQKVVFHISQGSWPENF